MGIMQINGLHRIPIKSDLLACFFFFFFFLCVCVCVCVYYTCLFVFWNVVIATRLPLGIKLPTLQPEQIFSKLPAKRPVHTSNFT